MNLDFSDIKVLLIGDFMIDHYIIGTSNRMSPEAPVPVVIPDEEYSIPGGAGNVAMNLSAMGANVTCVGIVGNDDWGRKLFSILNNRGINTDNIDIIDNHPTTLKKRV
jgi:rfaE bifunctional protein kinase chain/domain